MSDAAWMAEFLRLFLNPNATRDDIHQAFQLKNENLPRLLYRYRWPEDYSIDELENDSVFVAQPSGQNDLLDSICMLSSSDVFRAIQRAQFMQIIQKTDLATQLSHDQQQHCAQSEDPFKAMQEVLISNAAFEQRAGITKMCDAIRKIIEEQFEKQVGALRQLPHHHLRISCFTTDCQSTSMWDRYASKHTGLCIGYDFSLLPSDELRRRWLYPVVYRDVPFDLTPFVLAHIERAAISPLWPIFAGIHKSADWSNENEWRLIMPPEVVPTPRLEFLLKPSAVYLGARMEPNKQQRAEEIARRRGISVFKMEVSHREGRLLAHAT